MNRNDLSYVIPSETAKNWGRSERLWQLYLAAGGSLSPEYHPTDPMHEIYLAEGLYETHSIPDDLVREDVNFESLIEITRRCESLEEAQFEIEKFRRELSRNR